MWKGTGGELSGVLRIHRTGKWRMMRGLQASGVVRMAARKWLNEEAQSGMAQTER